MSPADAQNTSDILTSLADSISNTNDSLKALFTLTMAIVVFFMQCGFAFLESGTVHAKNTTSILMKNMLNCLVSCICYYAIGWAVAFGQPANAFCGFGQFALAGVSQSQMHKWLLHFVLAATAANIVCRAVTERCQFIAALVYSVSITGFVHPIASHWAWAPNGWLARGISIHNGTVTAAYVDTAGSGVIHVTGGTAGLVASWLLGPRLHRFDPNSGAPAELRGHSTPLAAFGGFVVLFGFLGVNGGGGHLQNRSFPNDTSGSSSMSVAIATTMISASAAGASALLLQLSLGRRASLLTSLNTGLSGMVAASAGCDLLRPWAAGLLGVSSAASYCLWSSLLLRWRLDDPLHAVAVHLGGGLCGGVGVALLRMGRGVLLRWDAQAGLDLLMQIVGLAAIAAWAAAAAAVVSVVLRLLALLRVSGHVEVQGLDAALHGGMAYPLCAYGHGWDNDAAVPEIGAAKQPPDLARSFDMNGGSVALIDASAAAGTGTSDRKGLQHVADLAVTYM